MLLVKRTNLESVTAGRYGVKAKTGRGIEIGLNAEGKELADAISRIWTGLSTRNYHYWTWHFRRSLKYRGYELGDWRSLYAEAKIRAVIRFHGVVPLPLPAEEHAEMKRLYGAVQQAFSALVHAVATCKGELSLNSAVEATHMREFDHETIEPVTYDPEPFAGEDDRRTLERIVSASRLTEHQMRAYCGYHGILGYPQRELAEMARDAGRRHQTYSNAKDQAGCKIRKTVEIIGLDNL
jgi:hypothetical protein